MLIRYVCFCRMRVPCNVVSHKFENHWCSAKSTNDGMRPEPNPGVGYSVAT